MVVPEPLAAHIFDRLKISSFVAPVRISKWFHHPNLISYLRTEIGLRCELHLKGKLINGVSNSTEKIKQFACVWSRVGLTRYEIV